MEKYRVQNKKGISLIFFEEMELAKHSPNKPLKNIHSQLEIDLNDKKRSKAAFVGILNSVLDEDKMNRGICISIPELSEEDIINTSKAIAESYNKDLINKFEMFFIHLGETYYKYKQYLKINYYLDGKEDFHGNRDFFHFIKYVSKKIYKEINTINESDLPLIGIKSIERNFSGIKLGIQDSCQIVKDIFNSVCKYNYLDIKEYGRF